MEPEKIFPDGFESYLETHFEMVSFISHQTDRIDGAENFVTDIAETQGTGGLYVLAQKWTDEFELLHKGREWDGEYFDALDEFFKTKNK